MNKELENMIECADCAYGFTPGDDGGKTLCDDCISQRHFWEEVDSEKLAELQAKIEVAWNASRDADLVDELAKQYPQFANELYEFFALLVEIELENAQV